MVVDIMGVDILVVDIMGVDIVDLIHWYCKGNLILSKGE